MLILFSLPPLVELLINHFIIKLKLIFFITLNFNPFSRLVECDSNIQEKVSNMPAVVNKLLFMIDRYQSEPAGYSLFSSQVASNALFYCTFNVKSAQSLVNCGAVEKLLHITKVFLNDNDGNTPLRLVIMTE